MMQWEDGTCVHQGRKEQNLRMASQVVASSAARTVPMVKVRCEQDSQAGGADQD